MLECVWPTYLLPRLPSIGFILPAADKIMTANILHLPGNTLDVPVIDLFAGPGGLGEGFSAYSGPYRFNISLSVEKDPAAHRTLELRSFLRQFQRDRLPDEYYRYVRGGIVSRDELFAKFPDEAKHARSIAWLAELGKEPHTKVLDRIRNALGSAKHWVLLGGPPCQAYSVMGRSRMGKMEKFAEDHRHTLYREYLKILAAFQPTVFVMENVKGILSSKHKDEAIFGRILSDMRDPWEALLPADREQIPAPDVRRLYRIFSFSTSVEGRTGELDPLDYLIESEKYAVPQKRHRVILLGIRDDYDVIPSILNEVPGVTTLRDVIGTMPTIRSRLSSRDKDGRAWRAAIRRGRETCTANCQQRFWGLGQVVRGTMTALSADLRPGGSIAAVTSPPKRLAEWLFDPRLGATLQHEARSHMETDLHRYFFSACFAKMYGRAPKLDEFPDELLPKHENAIVGDNGKVANFRDRFRVQLWDDASTTITSHLAKDGHYFIHPDPLQCRSLTVREAARLQTFPDNYFFEGSRTEQYHQIGNAVPPFLAYQLAGIVAGVMSACVETDRQNDSATDARHVAGMG